MTTSQAASFDTDHDRLRKSIPAVAAAVLVATAALTTYGAHDLREILVVMAIVIVTVAGVFGFLLPRKLSQESAGGTALALSLVGAVLLLPAFWAGVPLVLGVAGAMLGYAGRNARSGSGKSTVALAIGALVSVGYFAVYVLDALAQQGIS